MTTAVKPLVVPGRWNFEFTHAAGETASRFFHLLAEKKEIWGKRCSSCQRTLLPPRSFCERCFVKTTDWVKVDLEGQIEAFTIVYERFTGLPQPPYAIAYVRLGKADTALANYVQGVDLSNAKVAAERLRIGTRVQVVFKDRPEGRITDFWYEIK